MVKIQKDKKGYWTRYKRKKIYIPKKMQDVSHNELIKWLVKKIINVRKRKKSKPRAKSEVKQGVDKNLIKIAKDENVNKQPEDKTATLAYLNALRNQQSLPPLIASANLASAPGMSETTKDKTASTSTEIIPHTRAHTHVPYAATVDEDVHGSVASYVKEQRRIATRALKLAKDAEDKAKAEQQKLRDEYQKQIDKSREKREQNKIDRRPKIIEEIAFQGRLEYFRRLAEQSGIPITNRKGNVSKLNLVQALDLADNEIIRIQIEEELERLYPDDDEMPGLDPKEEAEEAEEGNEGDEEGDSSDGEEEHKDDAKAEEQAGVGVGLSNIQIDKFMEGHPEYLGTIASDEITSKIVPKIKPHTTGSFIMNLDDHTKPGTHWVACYFTPQTIEYYNSFGNEPTQSFIDQAKAITKAVNPGGFLKMKVNHIQRQDNATTTCGYHAMKFIQDREKGKSFSDATGYADHLKDDHVNGEKAVNKFIHHMTGNGFSFIDGNGIIDSAKEAVGKVVKRVKDIWSGVRQRASPSVRKFMAENGDSKITKIVVGRQPVTPMVEKVANWLSLGKYEENKKKMQYDKMFHLFMIVTLDNGKTFKLEKNHLPEISKATDPGKDAPSVKSPNVTLNEFIANGEKKAGGNKLWVYDAFDANCQYFVKWLLQGSGVWSSALEKFVMQDAHSTIEGMTWFQKLAKKLTDTANVLDVAKQGEGKKRRVHYIVEID